MRISRDPLDILFSKYIRVRANGVCEYCGKYKEFQALQCSHFWGRRNQSTRFDPENCAALCFGCHRYFTENPDPHREFFYKRLGETNYKLLMLRANKPRKPDRKMIEIFLKQELEKYVN